MAANSNFPACELQLSDFDQIWHRVLSFTLECLCLAAKLLWQKYANTLKVVIYFGVALKTYVYMKIVFEFIPTFM
jgi:hypothetical protein